MLFKCISDCTHELLIICYLHLQSGISQIRFRVYQRTCKRHNFHIYKERKYESSREENQKQEKTQTTNEQLLSAYRSMLRANIPAVWRILERDDGAENVDSDKEIDETVTAELWVFWMDDKHTGIVDRNVFLEQLEGKGKNILLWQAAYRDANDLIIEVRVGSFSWENIFLSDASPAASPISPVAKANAPPNTSLSQEYRFFVKAVRNVIAL